MNLCKENESPKTKPEPTLESSSDSVEYLWYYLAFRKFGLPMFYGRDACFTPELNGMPMFGGSVLNDLLGFVVMLHSYDNISLFVSFFNIPESLSRLFQRIAPINDRF